MFYQILFTNLEHVKMDKTSHLQLIITQCWVLSLDTDIYFNYKKFKRNYKHETFKCSLGVVAVHRIKEIISCRGNQTFKKSLCMLFLVWMRLPWHIKGEHIFPVNIRDVAQSALLPRSSGPRVWIFWPLYWCPVAGCDKGQ
jgi:hypothetical protein